MEMQDRTNSPAWGVYDLYRTARLNVRYYSARLHEVEMLNMGMEIVIAATAPTSAIAALWFWDTPVGSATWKTLGVIAAIAAVTKPIMMLPKKMKAYNEVLAGYRALEHDLYEIKEMIIQNRKYGKEQQLDYKKALKRKGVLAAKDPETKQDKSLIKRLVTEINHELPAASFYIPSE
jgi:hypothetical protein